MKICLSSRQTPEYLKQAEEIKVQYRDINQIYDLYEQYSSKNIILECNSNEIDWKEINKLNTLSKRNKNHLILQLAKIADIKIALNYGINNFWGFPVSTYAEIDGLMQLYGEDHAPAYVVIAPPLTHDIKRVANVIGADGIPLRVVPNIAYADGFEHKDGVCGGWIRPEDIDAYATSGVGAIEFAYRDIKHEQTLFRIYKSRQWTGELGLIISDLNYPGVNRMIHSDSSLRRMNCEQKCLTHTTACRICYRMLDLAKPELIQEYLEATKQIDIPF